MARWKILDLLTKGETPPSSEPKPLSEQETLFGFPDVAPPPREPLAPPVRKLRVQAHNEMLDRPKNALYNNSKNNKKSKRKYLWEIQKGLCLFCDEPFTPKRLPTLDHIIPRIKGGSDDVENLCLVCAPCNSLKGGFASFEEAAEYAAKIATETERKRQDALRLLILFKKLRDKGVIR